MPLLASWKKIDDYTVSMTTTVVASFFQWMVPYCCSPRRTRSRRAARTGARSAAMGPAGTGPFKITGVVPRQSVTLARNDDYWDPAKKAKVDKVILMPIPEANTRLAALRSGQVDWVEVPPPDGIPSLKQAGFVISTGSYPHVWPWLFNMARQGQPAEGRARAAGAELLHRPRRHRGAAERHRRAFGRLAEAQRSGLRQSGEQVHVRSGQGKEAAGRGRLFRQEAAVVQGHDLDLRFGPDAAAADERGAAGEPQDRPATST